MTASEAGPSDPFARYHRQMLLPGIGREGQDKLAAARVLIVGCGALGTVLADTLARAGVGFLRIVDRDLVELTNLQRQVLFTEEDVAEGMPKAEAARRAIGRINHQVRVESIVADFNYTNAESLMRDVDVILDGLDNFQTRYLLNDLAVKLHRPYIYGGAVGVTGMSTVFLPAGDTHSGATGGSVRWSAAEATPCLRCLFPEAPPAGSTPTCDTAGVLGSAVGLIAHHQSVQAIKLLIGAMDAVDRSLLSIDVWRNETRRMHLAGARRDDCPCCAERRFDYLRGEAGSAITTLCGRGAVQVNPAAGVTGAPPMLDLAPIAARLAPHGSFTANGFLLRGELAHEPGEGGRHVELTLFPDGRAIFTNITRPEQARSLYDRYIGG